MKRHFTAILLSIATTPLFAQEATVHVDGQPLADLLTEEQCQTLNTLSITGKLSAEDYAFMRGDRLKNIETLNLRNTDIDSIPAQAFKEWNKKTQEFKLILPQTVEYIGDSAFFASDVDIRIELTGKFPECGACLLSNQFGWRVDYQWEIAADNVHCLMAEDDYIVSQDGKIVYNTNKQWGVIHLPEGIEIVAPYAFDMCTFSEIILPESVDSIGHGAFRQMRLPDVATGSNTTYQEEFCFVCKAQTPPALGRGALDMGDEPLWLATLYVPDESVELYSNTDGWKDAFRNVKPISQLSERKGGDSSIGSPVFTGLFVNSCASYILCTSSTAVRMEVYTPEAVKVGEAAFVSGKAQVQVGKTPATYFYTVTYPNGQRESGKVIVR